VAEFADDFGYDLDEEGQPLEGAESERVTGRRETQPEAAGVGAQAATDGTRGEGVAAAAEAEEEPAAV
jgi:hypothetical protein